MTLLGRIIVAGVVFVVFCGCSAADRCCDAECIPTPRWVDDPPLGTTVIFAKDSRDLMARFETETGRDEIVARIIAATLRKVKESEVFRLVEEGTEGAEGSVLQILSRSFQYRFKDPMELKVLQRWGDCCWRRVYFLVGIGERGKAGTGSMSGADGAADPSKAIEEFLKTGSD